MGLGKKVEYLIVDTSAFIRNAALQDIGENVITEPAVVSEITSKRQLRRLIVLPYDLAVKEAFPENVQIVTEFAKKTGDYASLSATDIKVIALTYQLEKEKVGTDHLKSAPKIPNTVDASVKKPDDLTNVPIGFYLSQKTEENAQDTDNQTAANGDSQNSSLEEENSGDCKVVELDYPSNNSQTESDCKTACSNDTDVANLQEKFSTLNCIPEDLKVDCSEEIGVDDILAPVKDVQIHDESAGGADESGDDGSEEYESSDDEGGWITPSNIVNVKKQMDSGILEDKPAKVACLTMDFAMQNVLMQMGLNVASLDGRVIKQMRTFILRCYACFKTTSIMTKVFCPNCGNKTLKKVAISLDDDGNQQIHINLKRPLSAKGKKFSLPTPQGGKHASNPVLCEDQPMPDQRPTRLARTKNNPLDNDWIAGYSPFVMRDVNSKSAMLGIRPGDVKHWMRRNPNESRRKKK